MTDADEISSPDPAQDPQDPAQDPAHDGTQDRVLIVDFGSQVTQLIARRVREAGVYSEIVPFDKAEAALGPVLPKAIILSGGPASVHETGTPRAPQRLFTAGVPVLGICYGEQAMVAALGGQVEAGREREFGRAELQIIDETPLFAGVFSEGERAQVWMSHGDRVTKLPPGFRAVGISTGAPFAAIADDSRRLYGVQFHPEVVHTPKGAALIANFVREIAGCSGEWSMAQFREAEVQRIRDQVDEGRVVCGLSGGVDSAVAALLIHEAIGDQLTCIFVDHGLLRQDEATQVVDLFRGTYNIPLIHVDASERFLRALDVRGDARTYDFVCALRAVTSTDGMTADYYDFSHEFLGHAARRIINEVRGINRVVYDITSKPPGTIEWE